VCFANGCASFWTVLPKRRVVMITNPKGVTVTINESSTAQLPPPLSGSFVSMSAIFAAASSRGC
jgi:hypothetical protein